MKNLKLIVSALALVATATTFAQYASTEVALVADLGGTTTSGGTVSAQIERYDPISGQYLGAFGAGYVSEPYGMAVVGQNVYVSDIKIVGSTYYSRINEFNWSTGAYLGSIFNGAAYEITGLTVYGNSLIACDYGDGTTNTAPYALRTFDLTTGNVLGTTLLPVQSYAFRVTTIGNQVFVASSANGGGIYRYNLNANGTTTGAVTHFGANAEEGLISYTDKSSINHIYSGGFNGSNKYLEDYSASTGASNQALTLASASGGYSALGFGHAGMLYGLDNGTNKIDKYDVTTPFYLGSLGSVKLNYTSYGSNMVIYTAPEPLTLAAFGLGLLAIVRRRPKKA